MKRNLMSGLIALLIPLAFSCSKDEDAPAQTNQAINEAQLIGKWEVLAVISTYYDQAGKALRSGETRKGDANWRDTYTTFMTFNADKSFTHSNADGSNQGLIFQDLFPSSRGKWALTDENKTLQMDTFTSGNSFASWKVLEFSEKKMKITYTDLNSAGEKHERTIEMIK